MGRLLVAVLGVGATWVAATACTVDAVSLEGKKCPCADGYVCDALSKTCVADGLSFGGVAGKDGGSGGAAGASGTGGLAGDGGTGGTGGVKTGGTGGGGTGGTGGTGGVKTGGTGGGGTGGTGGTGGVKTGGTGGGGTGGTGGGGTGGTGGTGGGCPTGQKLCDGACVSTSSPTHGCASTMSCNPCPSGQPNATASCFVGFCGITCNSSSWGNCDMISSNGCETPLNASGSTAHCGKCNRSCSINHAAATTCTTGSCAPLCTDGYGNCNEASKPAPDDGCETALGNTTGHCGACGNSCSLQGGTLSKFSCAEGKCGCSTASQCEAANGLSGVSCNSALHLCVCEGSTCKQGEACSKEGPKALCSCNGGAACPTGSICCGTGCKNPLTDEDNCGGCGRSCGPAQTCNNGACFG